ncbi:DUF6268 family outer membrane beta-barrel protein [Pontibacter arcticus]|uniref:DUF6268 domain-containing protein n=1 Tax=Pontibacter arcticus TaxID=2080288 RepID=A0A364RIA6_9BACT|nr:DUF6268 family outer membrane beta-barrel protein [Pontibacter arcticus]RAU84027.1 hypothetical protein DP923_02920 [Pontibacter arcticus]
MNLKIYLLGAFCLLAPYVASAQQTETEATETVIDEGEIEYASPSVLGTGRGKGLVIGYERLPQFDIDSESDNPAVGNGNSRVRRFNQFFLKVNAPVVNKPRTKVVVGFDYEFEEYNFENVNSGSYSLYENLEDKNLKSIGAQVVFLRSLNEKNFYLVRLKGELNGDYTRDNINTTDYLRTTIDVGYGWKKSPYFAWGVGFQIGYNFGRRSIYPAIIYNRTYNDKWGVEAIFPANVKVRYNVSDKTLLYAGYRLEGASYNLSVQDEPLSQFGNIELRRTDVKAQLRLEQEIYDFLWFGVEGGFRQNYRNRVFDEIGSRDELIINDIAGAGYVSVELFIVPPRAMLDKSRKRR